MHCALKLRSRDGGWPDGHVGVRAQQGGEPRSHGLSCADFLL